jgi:hypothetical protein
MKVANLSPARELQIRFVIDAGFANLLTRVEARRIDEKNATSLWQACTFDPNMD